MRHNCLKSLHEKAFLSGVVPLNEPWVLSARKIFSIYSKETIASL